MGGGGGHSWGGRVWSGPGSRQGTAGPVRGAGDSRMKPKWGVPLLKVSEEFSLKSRPNKIIRGPTIKISAPNLAKTVAKITEK